MNKLIINLGEKTFAEIMEKQGKTLIYQPYLKAIKLRPDFYCIEDKTYYEIIANRQSYHARKEKIEKAHLLGIKIKIVHPDGSIYKKNVVGRPKKQLECLRCGHKWNPYRAEVRICPKCKSAWWDKKK